MPSPNHEPVLRVSDVVKVYPPALRALAGVDLELLAGRVHGLLGANGAGKSTLIKLLCGIEQPTSGQIIVGGQDRVFASPADAHAAGIGVLHQELPLLPNLSAAENAMLGLQAGGMFSARGRRLCNEAYRAAARNFPGAPPADALLGELGLQAWQLTAIIRAQLSGARMLILDEPTSSLDPRERRVLHDNLRRLAREGVAILYVSHFLDDVLEVCDFVTVLRDARVALACETGGLSEADLLRAMVGEDLAGAVRPRTSMSQSAGPGLAVESVSAGIAGPVSFQVPPGGRLGLYGLEGSGCREVLLGLFGLIPHRGRATWRGRVLSGDTRARIAAGLGFVSGDRARTMVGAWSVAANCGLPDLGEQHMAAWLRRGAERRKAADAIRRVAVKGRAEQPLRTLSGGNQQKVALARWLDRDSLCLLADEPTRGVDVRGRAAIHDALIGFCAHARNALVVRSTDPDELVELCDRVLVMVAGRVATELTGDRLTTEELEAATRTAVRRSVAA